MSIVQNFITNVCNYLGEFMKNSCAVRTKTAQDTGKVNKQIQKLTNKIQILKPLTNNYIFFNLILW